MDCFNQRALIDRLAARSVDEVSALLHCFEKVRSNQHASVRLQSDVHADDVRGARDFERHLFAFNSQLFGFLAGKTAAPRNNRHAERAGTRNHLLTNLAHTNQPQCAAKQSAGFGEFFLVPLSGAQSDNVVRDAAIECEDQSKRKFGNSN